VWTSNIEHHAKHESTEPEHACGGQDSGDSSELLRDEAWITPAVRNYDKSDLENAPPLLHSSLEELNGNAIAKIHKKGQLYCEDVTIQELYNLSFRII